MSRHHPKPVVPSDDRSLATESYRSGFTPLIVLILLVFSGSASAYNRSVCNEPVTRLSAIQGQSGPASSVDRWVTVEAVVVADFPKLGGFFIEAPPNQWTKGKNAPEGLFVYASHWQPRLGERLRIHGQVRDYHGQIELARVHLRARCGQSPLPPLQSIPVSATSFQHLSRWAGMRVSIAPGAVLVDTHELARYGSVELAAHRQFQPTQVMAPGKAAARAEKRDKAARLWLDDGSDVRYPKTGPWQELLRHPGRLRLGDTLSRAQGIIDYRFGHWRLELTRPPRFESHNPRPQAPARPLPNRVRVVSFNLENYFNGDGQGGGFPTARGARTELQFQRQRRHLVTAIKALHPDILAVMELENDGYGPHSAIAGLAHALGPVWRFVRPSSSRLGTDAIAVGLLYRSDRVHTQGRALVPDARVLDWGNRVPLGQVFLPDAGGPPILVMANHFKSRRCGHAHGRETAQGDGQGCWNPLRTRATDAVVSWLENQALPSRQLLVGDLNAYANESPLTHFVRAGYVPLVARYIGKHAYSFSYQGLAGALDHALASQALVKQVRQVSEWHDNADELPQEHDQAGSGPWRASDHDPLIVDLATQ